MNIAYIHVADPPEPNEDRCEAYAVGHLRRKDGRWVRCSRYWTRKVQTTTEPVRLCTFHANRLDKGHDIHGTDGAGDFRIQTRKSA